MGIKKLIAAIIGGAVLIWLISPIPEISIIVGFFAGGALSAYFKPIIVWPGVVIGCIVGTIIVKKFGLIEKLKEKFR